MKQIVKIKKYSIEHHYNSDGNYKVVRTCDGFTALELLGIIAITKDEILKQISGWIKPPTSVERNIIQDKKKATIRDIITHTDCNKRLMRMLNLYIKEYNVEFADEIDIIKISKFLGAGRGSIELLKKIINELNK